jgi:hypothetical protein
MFGFLKKFGVVREVFETGLGFGPGFGGGCRGRLGGGK